MMFLLVLNVLNNPFQIPRSERNDPVASLPFERFWLNLVVDVIRAAAFQLADPVGDQEVWRSTQTDVHVRLDTAHRVKVNARRLNDLVSQVMIEAVFNPGRYHRQTILRVPGDVEIDLGVYAVRHCAQAKIERTLKRPMSLFQSPTSS